MNWDEYISRHCDSNRNLKQEFSERCGDFISEVKRWPRYRKAVELEDDYIKTEGYLANTSGLRHYLKNNLYPHPSMLSDADINELTRILNVLWLDVTKHMPGYCDIYDAQTGNLFTQDEIIQKYIDSLEYRYEVEFPEDLMWEAEYKELKEIWFDYLEDHQKIRLKTLDKGEQKQELLKLSESYAEYYKFMGIARSQKDGFISLWITESINKYIQADPLSYHSTSVGFDEADLLREIQDRLPILLNAEFNFDRHYFLLHKKYLKIVGVNLGQARAGKRAWFKPTRWESCFPSKILPKLLSNDLIVKEVVKMVGDLDPKDYWIASSKLLQTLEDFNLPQIKRFSI